jgi:hypothetical protein
MSDDNMDDLMSSLDTSDPQIAALTARMSSLQDQVTAKEKKQRKTGGGGKSVPRMTLQEQFVYDLALTEVDEPGGRRRDRIADGYAKTFDLLNDRVGTELTDYIEANGFTLQLFMATMKVYYSKEGRIARGEQARAKTATPSVTAQPAPVIASSTDDSDDEQADSVIEEMAAVAVSFESDDADDYDLFDDDDD